MSTNPVQGKGPEGHMGTPEPAVSSERWTAASALGFPRRVEKPWGYELIWAETDDYVGKLLFVRAGESLSLQLHEEKDETLYLYGGSLRLELGPGVNSLEPVELEVGGTVRIHPGVLHRMEAITDCTVFEASTAYLDDVIRVRDRYGRAPGTDSASG